MSLVPFLRLPTPPSPPSTAFHLTLVSTHYQRISTNPQFYSDLHPSIIYSLLSDGQRYELSWQSPGATRWLPADREPKLHRRPLCDKRPDSEHEYHHQCYGLTLQERKSAPCPRASHRTGSGPDSTVSDIHGRSSGPKRRQSKSML